MFPRNTEALERRKERMEREDRAPRLASEFPSLKNLKLLMTFKRGEVTVQPQHVRVIVVPRAPALFHVPCIDPECRRGGHEITDVVLSALRQSRTNFSGACPCTGELGSAAARCTGELLFEGVAEYG
jgi:hypothetical protein